ncbi:PepSY domain-containing protein [Stenotrophobium rhamnosiphilum]|uniref:PepSY domain-containing protein n=2 Tax=Stenotrophobium rhamnosiphilum TaxID=2029166 RepID=A0A2T5MEC6_9GAMM|nr:PepSY domain-containing protein [Stenotrophobium rhamnosiphilum]
MTDMPEHSVKHKSSFRSVTTRWRTRWTMPAKESRPAQPKRTLTATLREWHKRAGLGAFLFMGWLGISGVMLNQSASWGLDAARVDWTWLMAVYGLHAQSPETGFIAGGHWLAVSGEHSVLDGKLLSMPVKSPTGIVVIGESANQKLVVATYDSVLLLNPDGTRIDELQAGLMLPVSAIQRIGTAEKNSAMVVIEDKGLYGSIDGESWTKLPSKTTVNWAQPATLTMTQRQQFEEYARPSVAVEQLLIDMHSGRLFGRFGPYVIDLVGLGALWLSISGVWMMWRTNQARKRNVVRR